MNNSDLHSKQLFQPQLFSIRAQGGDRTVIALGSVFEVGNALLFPWEEHLYAKSGNTQYIHRTFLSARKRGHLKLYAKSICYNCMLKMRMCGY